MAIFPPEKLLLQRYRESCWVCTSSSIKYIFLFMQGLKARGNVEDWLGKTEEAMFVNLRKLVKASIGDYEQKERAQWVLDHCSQVILTVSQIVWCSDITKILEGDGDRAQGMRDFETKSYAVSMGGV